LEPRENSTDQNSPKQETKKPAKNLAFPVLNRVTIAGKLEADPPLRYTKRGIPVTNFIISTVPDDGMDSYDGLDRKPCYVSVVVWSQQAVQCNKYLRKGSTVLIYPDKRTVDSIPRQKYTSIRKRILQSSRARERIA